MYRKFFILTAVLTALAAPALAQESLERQDRTRGRETGLFLDIQKFNLGTINNVEDKKQYLSTIQLEKQRIQNFTLRMAYYDAYQFYKRKDYQRAQDLAQAILTVDPDFTQARTLAEQSYRMGTYGTISEGEIISLKMEEGRRLYNGGRMVEAADKFEEVLTIQPRNAGAQSWYDRTQTQIAKEHEARGDAAYKEHRYDVAVDRWYSALLIRKDDPALVKKIADVELKTRQNQLEAAMQDGVDKYSKGLLLGSYDAFQKALKIQPAEPKAQKFSLQLRGEIASGYVASGNKALSAGRYDNAVRNWQEAKKWGYNAGQIDRLIASANRAKNAPKTPAAPQPAAGAEPGPEVPEVPVFTPEVPTDIIGRDPGARVVTAEQQQLSMDRYMAGLRAYNEEQYEEARKEFVIAKQLDPGNSDADAGIKKVDEMLMK
jgi:tetratricopeptide (TPR) repeat protein